MLRTEPVLIEEYVRTGKARLQFVHILDHANASVQASAAAECAGKQGAFWRMHDALFAGQDRLWDADVAALVELAGEDSLDAAQFRQCMDAGDMQERVRTIDKQAKAAGVRVRPTFDVNGQIIQGSPPVAQWRQLLNRK